MKNINNTKQRGTARIIIFPQGRKYIGVCLDFDLIEEARTFGEAQQLIQRVTLGYYINVRKNNLSDKLLNRHADKEYWDLYDKYQATIKQNNRAQLEEKIRNLSTISLNVTNLANKRERVFS